MLKVELLCRISSNSLENIVLCVVRRLQIAVEHVVMYFCFYNMMSIKAVINGFTPRRTFHILDLDEMVF